LEQALALIKQLRQAELVSLATVQVVDLDAVSGDADSNSASAAAAAKKISADKALEYVIFLADVNLLYDIALGMYDYDLAVMVAQKSSKDPKEYLPFLSEIKRLQPVALQYYRIDMHLGRWQKALLHLSQAGHQYFPQCLELIRQKGLYQQALEIFDLDSSASLSSSRSDESDDNSSLFSSEDEQKDQPKDAAVSSSFSSSSSSGVSQSETSVAAGSADWWNSSENRRRAVWELWAQSLLDGADYEAAGQAFAQCGLWSQALKSYRHTQNWRMVMAVLAQKHLHPNPPPSLRDLNVFNDNNNNNNSNNDSNGDSEGVAAVAQPEMTLEEETQKVAQELAQTYRNLARFADAASLLLDYCHSPIEAISCLVQGNLWTEAIRQVSE
jgi:hypothetical protein